MAQKRILFPALGLGFALIIGGLVVYNASTPDPAAIKADLEQKMAELQKLPPERIAAQDARAEELLAIEDYSKYARSLWLKLDRLHAGLHEAAKRDRAAEKEVPPFLARCKDLTHLTPEELSLRAGEGRSLRDSHGSSRFGPILKIALDSIARRQDELRAKELEDLKKVLRREEVSPATAVIELQRQVRVLVKQEQFAEALGLIDRFETLKLDVDMKARSQEQRDFVVRSARTSLDALLKSARDLEGEEKRAEATRLLEEAQPRYKGISEAGGIDAALRRLKPR